jgi:hypothetical protein
MGKSPGQDGSQDKPSAWVHMSAQARGAVDPTQNSVSGLALLASWSSWCSAQSSCWSRWLRRWPPITRRLGALLLSLVTQKLESFVGGLGRDPDHRAYSVRQGHPRHIELYRGRSGPLG